MIFTLHIWRQKNAVAQGYFEQYQMDVSETTSFLEMMDALNEQLISKGQDAIAFDFDCRGNQNQRQ